MTVLINSLDSVRFSQMSQNEVKPKVIEILENIGNLKVYVKVYVL